MLSEWKNSELREVIQIITMTKMMGWNETTNKNEQAGSGEKIGQV